MEGNPEKTSLLPMGKKLGRSICAGLTAVVRHFLGGVEVDSTSAPRGQDMLMEDMRSKPSSSSKRLRGVETESMRAEFQEAREFIDLCQKRE